MAFTVWQKFSEQGNSEDRTTLNNAALARELENVEATPEIVEGEL